MEPKKISAVVVQRSRFLGKTVQEGETVNSLTAQGPEAVFQVIRDFFNSDTYDTCTVALENGQGFSFTREQGSLKIYLEDCLDFSETDPEQGEEKDA